MFLTPVSPRSLSDPLTHALKSVRQRGQILFRHGDRSPTRLYPTDEHGQHWKQGLGQLTKTGIWRAFNLGKYLKKTYIDDLE